VDKAGTALKYHGGYFINSKKWTAYFETVFVAPVGLQRSFVSTSTIGELSLTNFNSPMAMKMFKVHKKWLIHSKKF
jgi:hypothetical protein